MLSTCLARVFLDFTAYLEVEIAMQGLSVLCLHSKPDRDLVHQCLLCINDLGGNFALLCA
jgi:hypothetical protein